MKAKALRSYLLAGVVVWVPILVTFALLHFIIDILDKTISLLPHAYQPKVLVGFDIPGLGVVLSLLLLIFTGMIVTNFVGQRLMTLSESILHRIPLVRTIYMATKQVMQAIFSSNGQAFRKVLLVEYPRQGIYSLAFQTSQVNTINPKCVSEELISIFVPTTPNPTAGFLLMVPKSQVIEIDMSIDEALAFIISLGVMNPNNPTIQPKGFL